MPALAYFLTWTGYGTWLHGDERGSVDDAHNRREMPRLAADSRKSEWAGVAMAESAFWLEDVDRALVDSAIRKTCEIRGWKLHGVNVRTNHMHVVVTASDSSPEHAAGLLKSWATRALKARHPGRKRFWTNQASTRPLFDDDSLNAAVRYTREQ